MIDLGLKTKDEAEKLVKIGDPIVFDTKFEQISHNCYIGKALDDRLGCAIIAETLKEEFRFPVVALFLRRKKWA